MSVKIRPFKNIEGKVYEKVVYVDGEVLPKQTVEGPWIENGVVLVNCITDNRLNQPRIDPEKVPYQVKPFVVFRGKSGKGTEELEITSLWLKLD